MSLATIRDALHAWAVSGTGLAASKIIWADQGGPRPAAPYVSLAIIVGDQMAGLDWLDVEDAESPVDGADIRHIARGPRTAALSVQCFGPAATAADGVGGDSPLALLALMRARARLPTVRAALRAAGVGLGDLGPVNSVGSLISTVSAEPRAAFTAQIHYTSEVGELGTFIETAEVEGDLEV